MFEYLRINSLPDAKNNLKQFLVKYTYKKLLQLQEEYQKYVDSVAHNTAAHDAETWAYPRHILHPTNH